MDPSLVQIMTPYYFMVANLWHHAQIPLWNAFSGFGCPLLADPQSTAFSPLHLPLALFPSMRTYNLTLVAEVWIMLLGTYFLSRTVGFNRLCSLFAATTFTFCPYILHYLELLGNGYCLMPLVWSTFVLVAKEQSTKRAVIAGVACAAVILSGHPELSFFCILFGSMLCFLGLTFNTFSDHPADCQKQALLSIRLISISALVAFCLAAPMLLPFGELISNSDSYKFGAAAPSFISFRAILISLCVPGFKGASPYLGPLILLTIPFALSSATRKRSAILFVSLAILSLFFTARVFPMDMLFQVKPFTYIVSNYASTPFLLLATLCATFGLEALLNKETKALSLNPLAESALWACVVLGFAKMWLTFMPMSSLDFDLTLPHFSAATRDWLNAGIFISLSAILIAVARSRLQSIALIGIISIGLTGELVVAKNSMPVQPAFEYKQTPLLQDLANRRCRIVCVGDHLLKPNTNIIYGINQVSWSNPIFPKRYLTLLNAFGCKMDAFNQTFSFNLSPLLNLASVQDIVSQTPVKPNTINTYTNSLNPSVEFANGLRLNRVDYMLDPKSGIFGKLVWSVGSRNNARYNYSIVLLNDDQKLLWFGDQMPLSDQPIGCEFAAPLPPRSEGTTKLGLYVFDTRTGKPVKALSGSYADAALVLGDITEPNAAPGGSPFILDKTYYQGIRIYQNKNALPGAYLVSNATQVASAAEALRAIQSSGFDPKSRVIIESSNALPGGADVPSDRGVWSTGAPSAPHTNQLSPPTASLTRPDSNTVIAECTTSAPAWLVLTDLFYPGWTATVDNNPAPIARANFCFRAVHIPAGKHTIKFAYQPLSFLIGACLSALCILVIFIYGAINFRSNQVVPQIRAQTR